MNAKALVLSQKARLRPEAWRLYDLAIHGHSQDEMAVDTGENIKRVKHLLTQVYRALGVRNRAHLQGVIVAAAMMGDAGGEGMDG